MYKGFNNPGVNRMFSRLTFLRNDLFGAPRPPRARTPERGWDTSSCQRLNLAAAGDALALLRPSAVRTHPYTPLHALVMLMVCTARLVNIDSHAGCNRPRASWQVHLATSFGGNALSGPALARVRDILTQGHRPIPVGHSYRAWGVSVGSPGGLPHWSGRDRPEAPQRLSRALSESWRRFAAIFMRQSVCTLAGVGLGACVARYGRENGPVHV